MKDLNDIRIKDGVFFDPIKFQKVKMTNQIVSLGLQSSTAVNKYRKKKQNQKTKKLIKVK